MSQATEPIPMPDLGSLTQTYMEAFAARDVERCLAFFHEDASIDFQNTVYRGREAITQWHSDRFAANFHMVKLDNIRVDGDTVTIDGQAASDRLAAWKIKTLGGRITMRFEGDKIREGKLSARMSNIFDLLRSGE